MAKYWEIPAKYQAILAKYQAIMGNTLSRLKGAIAYQIRSFFEPCSKGVGDQTYVQKMCCRFCIILKAFYQHKFDLFDFLFFNITMLKKTADLVRDGTPKGEFQFCLLFNVGLQLKVGARSAPQTSSFESNKVEQEY